MEYIRVSQFVNSDVAVFTLIKQEGLEQDLATRFDTFQVYEDEYGGATDSVKLWFDADGYVYREYDHYGKDCDGVQTSNRLWRHKAVKAHYGDYEPIDHNSDGWEEVR